MVVISVYTYGVKIIKKIPVGKWFSLGVPWNPPLCTNGSAGYLMQLSVNILIFGALLNIQYVQMFHW